MKYVCKRCRCSLRIQVNLDHGRCGKHCGMCEYGARPREDYG